MSYVCPNCKRTMDTLEADGKLRNVQGYAQCADCHADLEHEDVVKRSENYEMRQYGCLDCRYRFAWHMVFVGVEPRNCPRCGSAKVQRVSFGDCRHISLTCSNCGESVVAQGSLDGASSLWVGRRRCGKCGSPLSPKHVLVNELFVADEKPVCAKCFRELLVPWPGEQCVECFAYGVKDNMDAKAAGYLVVSDQSEQNGGE